MEFDRSVCVGKLEGNGERVDPFGFLVQKSFDGEFSAYQIVLAVGWRRYFPKLMIPGMHNRIRYRDISKG